MEDATARTDALVAAGRRRTAASRGRRVRGGRHVADRARWRALAAELALPGVREPLRIARASLGVYVVLSAFLLAVDGRFWLDVHLQAWAARHHTAGEDHFFRGIVDHLSPDICAAAAVAFGIGASWGRRTLRPLVVVAVGIAATALTVNTVRDTTGRGLTYLKDPRFDQLGPGTYPSGHLTMALASFVLAVLVVAPDPGRVRTALLRGALGLWALLSVSLTLIDSHWVTDDVAGLLHVAVVLGLLAAADAWWRQRGPRLAVPAALLPVVAPVLRRGLLRPAADRNRPDPDTVGLIRSDDEGGGARGGDET